MKKLVLSFAVLSILTLISCGGSENSSSKNNGSKDELSNEATNRLDFAMAYRYHTLDPLQVNSVTDFHITSQIYEPLLRFDEKDLSLQPQLAEYWTMSEDDLVLTIQLKKGVYFQDHPGFEGGKGSELTASDVIYTFEKIYSEKSPANYAYSLFRNAIKGGEEFRTGAEAISGLKEIDAYTVEFTLNKPSSNFISLLATSNSSIVPKKLNGKNAIIGTGPFTYQKENDTKTALTLLKNPTYHISDKQGNKLPYIDAVAYNYVKPGQDQLNLFMENKLDVITGIPPDAIKDLVESQIADFQDKPVKYVLARYPQVSTSLLNLNTAVAPFNNVKVRQAIGMALNKTKIVENVLKGEAFGPGDHGVVPPAIKNYDYSSVIGHEFNVEKAKELLTAAGYPEGNGFPVIKFGAGKGNTSVRVALEIQKQLRSNLNINVEISSLSTSEIIDLNGKSELNMSLRGWLGEFPDPITFLSLFYGADVSSAIDESSFPNEARYKNPKFDALYEQALVTLDDKKRYEICLTADQIIATDVPSIPLWYNEKYQLIKSNIKDYQPNSMNIQYLVHVKLTEPAVAKSK